MISKLIKLVRGTVKPNYIFYGTVKRVVDADTYEIEIELGFDIKIVKRIRLADIDTPETWRPKTIAEKEHGLLATAFVKARLLDQYVVLKSTKMGKYRYVADVFYIPNWDSCASEESVADAEHIKIADELKANGFEKRSDYPADEV